MRYRKLLLTQVLFFLIASTVLQAQTVKDIDGNVYKTVTIGTQVWMAENLKTSKYNDSTSIPLVLDNKAWKALKTPAYCWYDNDETANKNTYGALYNGYTINQGNLCPAGWHIPTVKEWKNRLTKMGGARKLKEIGLTHWQSPNKRATNETGFTALPGGYRNYIGKYYDIGNYGYWWSSPEYSPPYAITRYALYPYSSYWVFMSYRYFNQDGFSVRCLRD